MRLLTALLLAGLSLLVATVAAQESKPLPGSKDCLDCHDTGRRTERREAGVPPAFDAAALRASPHADLECRSCHADLEKAAFPHPEKLKPVDCGSCHSDEQTQYAASLHGRATARGDRLAPDLPRLSRHPQHPAQVQPPLAHSTMEIPGYAAAAIGGNPGQPDPQHSAENILGNYMDSIHGEGLFKRASS
jgi:hypothetical protein